MAHVQLVGIKYTQYDYCKDLCKIFYFTKACLSQCSVTSLSNIENNLFSLCLLKQRLVGIAQSL